MVLSFCPCLTVSRDGTHRSTVRLQGNDAHLHAARCNVQQLPTLLAAMTACYLFDVGLEHPSPFGIANRA